jgi:hypothetical protein
MRTTILALSAICLSVSVCQAQFTTNYGTNILHGGSGYTSSSGTNVAGSGSSTASNVPPTVLPWVGNFNGTFTGNGQGLTGTFAGVTPAAAAVAQTFASTNSIADPRANADVALAVQQYYNYGVASNAVFFATTMPRFNATNHNAIIGGKYSVTNDTYGSWGETFWLSNMLTAKIGSISNCTMVVTIRTFIGDAVLGNPPTKDALCNLQSTNDQSCFLATVLNPYDGIHVMSSAGTNFLFGASYGPVIGNQSTNSCLWCQSGEYLTARTTATTPTTFIFSYNTNGTISAWRMGQSGLFSSGSYSSNLLYSTIATAPFNLFSIGGNAGWFGTGPNYTNFQGELGSIQIFNQSCEQNTNIPAAATAAALCLEDCDSIVEFNGSSRLNYEDKIYFASKSPTSSSIVVSNSIPYIISQLYPRTFVIQNAFPGSTLAMFTAPNGGGSIAANFPFHCSIQFAPSQKYRSRAIVTDCIRNDIFNGTATTTFVPAFRSFYLPYVTNGIEVDLFESGTAHYAAGGTQISIQTNMALWQGYQTMETNFPFGNIIREIKSLTYEKVTLSGIAFDGIHVGSATNVIGYRGAVECAQLIMRNIPPAPFSGGTNLVVGGNPWLWTNYWGYPVTVSVYGGTVTGIGKNYNQVGSGSGQFRLQSGDILAVTNSVAPTAWMDSTQ